MSKQLPMWDQNKYAIDINGWMFAHQVKEAINKLGDNNQNLAVIPIWNDRDHGILVEKDISEQIQTGVDENGDAKYKDEHRSKLDCKTYPLKLLVPYNISGNHFELAVIELSDKSTAANVEIYNHFNGKYDTLRQAIKNNLQINLPRQPNKRYNHNDKNIIGTADGRCGDAVIAIARLKAANLEPSYTNLLGDPYNLNTDLNLTNPAQIFNALRNKHFEENLIPKLEDQKLQKESKQPDVQIENITSKFQETNISQSEYSSIDQYKLESETKSESSSSRSGSKGSAKFEGGQQLLLEFFIPDSANCIYFPEERFLNKMEKGSVKAQIVSLIKALEELDKSKGLDDSQKLKIKNAIHRKVFNTESKNNEHLTELLNKVLEPEYFTKFKADIIKRGGVTGLLDEAIKTFSKSKDVNNVKNKFDLVQIYNQELTKISNSSKQLRAEIETTVSQLREKHNHEGASEKKIRGEETAFNTAVGAVLVKFKDGTTKTIPIKKSEEKQAGDKDVKIIYEIVVGQYDKLFEVGKKTYDLTQQNISQELLSALENINLAEEKLKIFDKKLIKEEIEKLKNLILDSKKFTVENFDNYNPQYAWGSDSQDRRGINKFIKEHCKSKISATSNIFSEHKQQKNHLEQIEEQISKFKQFYFSAPNQINQPKLLQDISIIRGHSESELVNKITLDDIKDYDPKKLNKVYVLLVSSNEICSACTNVIPEIRKTVLEKLKLSDNDKNKVQILYFPIAEPQENKLYIKKNELEKQYEKNSSDALEEDVIIIDASKHEYQKVELSKEIEKVKGFHSQSIKTKKSQLPIFNTDVTTTTTNAVTPAVNQPQPENKKITTANNQKTNNPPKTITSPQSGKSIINQKENTAKENSGKGNNQGSDWVQKTKKQTPTQSPNSK